MKSVGNKIRGEIKVLEILTAGNGENGDKKEPDKGKGQENLIGGLPEFSYFRVLIR